MSISRRHHPLVRSVVFILALAFAWGASADMAYGQRRWSAITAFHDFGPYSPGVHVVYQDVWGAIDDYYWVYNSPGWQFAAVTPQNHVNVAQLIGYSDGNQNHIFAVRPDAASNTAHIVEWYGYGVPTNYNDLTAATQTSDQTLDQFYERPAGSVINCYSGQKCLESATTLAGYAEFLYDDEHVFYTGQDGSVKELYHSIINSDVWHDHILSNNAYALNGEGLAAEFDGMGVQHVFYTDYDQHIQEVYYYNGNWWGSDWTGWGGLGLDDYDSYIAASYDSGTNSSTVFAVPDSSSNQLQTLTHFGTASTLNTFTATVPNFAPGQPIISYHYIDSSCPATQPACTPTTMRETAYIGTDSSIYEFNGYTALRIPANATRSYCRPSSYSAQFGFRNGVTTTGDTLTGLWDGTYRHLFFINYNGDVMELVASPNSGWTLNDISCWSGSYAPAQ